MARLLLVLIQGCIFAVASAAESPPPEIRADSDVSTISVDGSWGDGSRVYEVYPGRFEIKNGHISLRACKSLPYTRIRDDIRNDEMWYGDASNQKKNYRDISIEVENVANCLAGEFRVFRFLITGESPCMAILMLYASKTDLENNHYAAWGAVHNQTCYEKAKR